VSSPDGQSAGLTPRECAVLAASATGRTVAEVAELLGQSPEEVRRHLGSAIARLGARSKLEAVLVALRRGLITLVAL
jgi:DNA-binding CsgD family transcriptional regulator